MNKKLIIGSNSSIVKKIRKFLRHYDFVSHNDLSNVDYGSYSKVILFSWSFKSIDDNKEIIEKIPLKKIVFISSASIFSLQIRSQWNSYPNNKKIIEDYVLSNGGTILRLGVMNPTSIKYKDLVHPFTDQRSLIKKLNNIDSCQDRVINLFNIKGESIKVPFLPGIFHKITYILPNIRSIRILFEIISKYFLNTFYYGYSADTLDIFSKNIQIGYGVLGSNYRINKKLQSKIIVSNRPDLILNKHGFKGTILGFNKTGLSKFWHGAYLSVKDKIIYKHVPKIVLRPKIPFSAFRGHVDKIIDKENFFEILAKDKNKTLSFFCSKIILAAGTIENSRLLNSLIEKPHTKLFFSDQEWTSFGVIDVKDAIEMNYIKKYGPFIMPSKLLLIKTKKYSSLIEFRPFSRECNSNLSFYSDSTKNIIFKLFKQFSLSRINEAVFNKFGCALISKKICIIGQIKAPNSISMNLDGYLTRIRIQKKIIDTIRSKLKQVFSDFEFFDHYLTSDSQHITGDQRLLNNITIKKIVQNKRLVILGSPTKIKLNEFYPTNCYIKSFEKGRPK